MSKGLDHLLDGADITIRIATACDLPAVQRVARITWRATYSEAIATSDIEHFLNWVYGDDYLEPHLLRFRQGFLVAEVNGAIVGYAMAGVNREREPELYSLYVLPEHHGSGVGSLLWDASLAHLVESGQTRMYCWVLESNVRARRFYERRGAFMCEMRAFPIGATIVNEARYCIVFGEIGEQAGLGSAACR